MITRLLVVIVFLIGHAVGQVCFDDYGSGFSNSSYTFLSNPLVSSDNQAKQRFGKALDIQGNRAVVCAYLTDSTLLDTGKCYVFVKSGDSWNQVQSFFGPNPGASDYFGYTVDMDGPWLIIGAPQDAIGGVNYAGSATVYHWNGAAYAAPLTLTKPVPTSLDLCGTAVGIQNGSYALIGCIGDDTVASDAGAVLVFKLISAGVATFNGTLTAPSGPNDNFGSALAIEGGFVVVGAAAFDGVGSNSGKGYLYDLTDGMQSLRYAFAPSTVASGDSFGTTVAISHPYILVGAPKRNGNYSDSGASFLFYDNENSATQLAMLTDTDNPSLNAYFGSSGALFQQSASRLEIVVGAYNGRALGSSSPNGKALLFLFDITEGTMRYVTTFLAYDGQNGDYFGGALAVDGRTFMIGAERENTANGGSSTGAGTAYVYTLASCTNQSGVCFTVPFDVDAFGAPLASGTTMNTQYSSLEMTIVSQDVEHPVMLFDSSAPTCVDGTNVATPNTAFGGSGTGSGGTTSNSVDLDKILIAQNNVSGCTPEVAIMTTSFLFNFTIPITPTLITIVDGRTSGTLSTNISFYLDYEMTTLIGTTELPFIGTNGVQTLWLGDKTMTSVMKFTLGGPAGIASFSYCYGNVSV